MSELVNRQVSTPLSTFERTSKLIVNAETGEISGWEGLWEQLEIDDEKKKKF